MDTDPGSCNTSRIGYSKIIKVDSTKKKKKYKGK